MPDVGPSPIEAARAARLHAALKKSAGEVQWRMDDHGTSMLDGDTRDAKIIRALQATERAKGLLGDGGGGGEEAKEAGEAAAVVDPLKDRRKSLGS